MLDRIECTVARLARGTRALGFFLLVMAAFAQSQSVEQPAGSGTKADPYRIANLANLYWVSYTSMSGSDFAETHFLQTADIDASPTATWFGGSGWQPIGWPSYSVNNVVFSGSYNGQGFSISGLTMHRSEVDLGLFGAVFNAAIENVNLVDVVIQESSGATGDFVGGLVGELYGARVENCTVTGSVHGYNAVGGLVGVLNDPLAYGGDSTNRIIDCRSSASVQVDNIAGGGLIGAVYDPGATIDQCLARGVVQGATTMLPGQAGGEIGGLVGSLNGGSLTRSQASGRVFGYNSAGGLVGRSSGSITDCFATGLVEGAIADGVDHGGLIGTQEGGTVSHSFAIGGTNGAVDFQGGLIGRINGGTVEAGCYWNSSVQADGLGVQSSTTGFSAVGKSTAQLQTASTFSGWSAVIWSFADGRYPRLRMRPTVSTGAAGSIGAVLATLGGSVEDDGGASVTERGVVYSATDSAPAIGSIGVFKEVIGAGAGEFDRTITGLSAQTTYFARAFATNAVGTRYGSNIRFSTDSGTAPVAQPQTIAFGSLVGQTYGTPFLILTAKASSGLKVSYISADPAVARISNDTVFLLAADTVTLTATQSGDDAYQAAIPVAQILAIAKKCLTIAGAAAQNKTYDGTTDAAVTGAKLVGVVDADDVSLVPGKASFANKNVGTGKSVTVSGSALIGSKSANYKLTEVAGLTANITVARITVTAQAKSKVEGTADPALTFAAPALFGSDVWSGALVRCPGEKPGQYPIRQGTLGAGSNYSITFVGANLTISKLSGIATRPQHGPRSIDLDVKIGRVFAAMARGSGSGSLGGSRCTEADNCHQVEVVLPAPSRVSVAVFDNLGNLVISFQEEIDPVRYRDLHPTPDGRKLLGVSWNLRSATGVAVQPGVFLWKMEVQTEDGRKWETIKRLGVK